VLRDEHKRAAYDLDLTEEAVKRKAHAAAADPTATTAADFGGPDPGAETGQWEDEEDRPVKPQSWNSQPYYAPRTPIWRSIRRNKYFNWVIVGLILWAVIVIATHFTNLIPGSGEPSFTPLPSSGPQASGVPIVNPGSDLTPTPSPSATPSCPTGTPSIDATSITPVGGNGFNPFGQTSNDENYTVSGTVTNSTSTAIQINTVGFYLGSYDSTRAPDNTVAWSNMTSGSTTVQPGQTVSWSTQMTLPSDTQNPPTAVLTFPDSDGATPTAQWSFVGSSASCSQPSSSQ
jgi:hypothetical protein